jgi:hypothetical protein
MKRSIVLSLALILAPVAALAQSDPPAGPPAPVGAGPSAAQLTAMRQVHEQAAVAHVQTRSRMLAALTPAHRAAVANVVGQLALAANPDPHAAALSLDAVFSPAEKQSIVNIAAAERSNLHALMQQARATFESTLTADERARMAQHEAKMQAMRQSHPLPPGAGDPGAIVLRTLGEFGGPGMHGPGMHGHAF